MTTSDDIPDGGPTPGDIVKRLLREWGRLVDVSGWTVPTATVPVGDLIVEFLRGVDPDAVMWQTLSGRFTAADLINHVWDNDDVGEQYAHDLLTIAFDMLRRRANAATPPTPPDTATSGPAAAPKLGVTNIVVTVDVGAINDPGVDYVGSVAQLTMFGLLRQASRDWDLWGVLAQRPDCDWRLFDAAHLSEASEWGSRAFVVTGAAP